MHDGQNDRGSQDHYEAASSGKKNEGGPQRIFNATGLSRVSKSLARYISTRCLILQVLKPGQGRVTRTAPCSLSLNHLSRLPGPVLAQTVIVLSAGYADQRLQTGATTGLTSSPSVSIRQVTTLPAASVIGGVRKMPTPAGVPVEMTSPGSSVMSSLM